MVQLAGVQLVPAVTHDGLSNELFGTVTGTVPAQAPDVTTKSATNNAIPKLVRIPILRFFLKDKYLCTHSTHFGMLL
jgi:hypothetical protein